MFLAPQSKQAAIVTSEGVAVGVGATILIECIIAALIIAMLLLCKKRRYIQILIIQWNPFSFIPKPLPS